MRVKVSLRGKGLIPFNYNLALAGAVYGPIKRINVELASSIHQSTDFKFFTFSLLQIQKRKTSEKGIYLEDGAHFFVSSPNSEFIHCFVEGILDNPQLRIGKVQFEVDTVEVLRAPELNGRAVFSTLSPIIVRTAEEVNGNLKIRDLYPTNPLFYENLRKNLIKKYSKLYGEERETIFFEKPFSTKQKRIMIRDTFHRANLMKFVAHGDTELLKLGYEAGFGEKNSMGFGMVSIMGGSNNG